MAVTDRFHRARPPRRARWAVGTAVLGRPAYINTGSAELPEDRSVSGMQATTSAVLDAATAAGIDWVDTARSYGRAEEFVGRWWRDSAERDPDFSAHAPTVSSKWGYAYVGDWDRDAAVHEVKEHSRAQFERQWRATRETLPHVHLYQVHSLTVDSPLFDDAELLEALADLRDAGVALGFTTSGPRQGETVDRAMDLDLDGRLFSAVQATWNLLETSVAPALARASRRELTVLVKESLANGRLVTQPPPALTAVAERHGVAPDAVALAAAAQQPFVDRVLLGPAGPGQLASNLAATDVSLTVDDLAELAGIAEPAERYWATRSALPWR
nr:aldo/keto reductase [Nakamurella flavida]